MSLQIGNWIRIKRPGRKWHRVESVIAGDAITKCGRRIPDPGFDTSKVEVLTRMIGQPQNCRYCDFVPLLEDDGSTAPTDETDAP